MDKNMNPCRSLPFLSPSPSFYLKRILHILPPISQQVLVPVHKLTHLLILVPTILLSPIFPIPISIPFNFEIVMLELIYEGDDLFC